ncbi:MAG: type II toxin-antitoxin system HicB family antitoxin [Synergistaceae bacterium]|nr:type II toxin-antitoxin system HicB family antitoxin [Synergistaceae bacterium]
MKDRYIFPAVFSFTEEGVIVRFPDLPGRITSGNTIEEALHNAREALEGFLWGGGQDNDQIPGPSDILGLKKNLRANQIVAPVEAFMPPVRAKIANKSVNKMVTLPKWMIDEGKRAGLNFSRVLQEAIKEKLAR